MVERFKGLQTLYWQSSEPVIIVNTKKKKPTNLILYIFVWVWCFLSVVEVINSDDPSFSPNLVQCHLKDLECAIFLYFDGVDFDGLWFRLVICGKKNN